MNHSRLSNYLPVLDWLPRYRKEWLRLGVVAGITTAAVVIPKAMAYAVIAGLPVEAGLYVALVPMLVYALLGDVAPAEREQHHDLGYCHYPCRSRVIVKTKEDQCHVQQTQYFNVSCR
jgi:hypothetical protein